MWSELNEEDTLWMIILFLIYLAYLIVLFYFLDKNYPQYYWLIIGIYIISILLFPFLAVIILIVLTFLAIYKLYVNNSAYLLPFGLLALILLTVSIIIFNKIMNQNNQIV